MILVLGKARSHRAPNLDYSRGWVTWVNWYFTKKLCIRCNAQVSSLSWWSCQSLVAHSCGLPNHPNSFCEGMFQLNAKFDADMLLYSLRHLSVMPTQYACSLSGIYCPHLVRWGCHCSHMCIPVHSPWLPGYIDVQTVLVIINDGWTFSRQTSYKAGITISFSQMKDLDVWKMRYLSKVTQQWG